MWLFALFGSIILNDLFCVKDQVILAICVHLKS
jgi:hypothetical protein